jgi:hypothetical protein
VGGNLAINRWFEAILVTINALFHQNTALGVTIDRASVFNLYEKILWMADIFFL